MAVNDTFATCVAGYGWVTRQKCCILDVLRSVQHVTGKTSLLQQIFHNYTTSYRLGQHQCGKTSSEGEYSDLNMHVQAHGFWGLRSRAVNVRDCLAFERAGYANQGWFPCIARRHRSNECFIRAVLLRCWKGLHCLSAAWHVRSVHGRLHVNIRFAASAVTSAISKLRTSSERKLSLSATRPPFTVEIALLYVFSLSNPPVLRQDPPLIWVFGHFWLFCTMV